MNTRSIRFILFCLLSFFCINSYAGTIEHINKHSNIDILTWAYKAMLVSHTYNFVKYKSQLKQAETYFTPTAWKNYQKNLKQSNLINKVINQKLVISMGTASSPLLLQKADAKWKVQIPIIINLQSANESQQQPLQLVTLTISTSSKGHNGLIIDEIHFSRK